MTAWEIWAEGYNDMGNIGHATLLTQERIEAESFDEAVAIHVSRLASDEARFFCRHKDAQWSMWACGLFPYETESRRFFG